MTTKLWGIPGTSHVPSPEKELKKLIDKAKRETQQEINKIANKAKKDTERALKKAANATQHDIKTAFSQADLGITASASLAEDAIKDVAEEAIDKVLEAVGVSTVGVLLNKLVDLAQAKLITKPVVIELFWFRFNVDVNDKIDALQRWADNPPTSADDVPDMILELCADDEVVFCPNFPIIGRVQITVGIDQLAALVKKAL